MAKVLFITDLHIKAESGVRVGNYLDDVLDKLDFVANYANENDCTTIFGGDIFDTSTLTDVVKNRLISTLRKFNKTPFTIWGNHDMRYNNHDFDEHTSLYNLLVSGVINLLDKVELDGCIIEGGVGEIDTFGRNHIAVRHGLLNKPDGVWCLSFDEISTLDNCVVLLGHDHTEYDDVKYGNVTVVRPGSFSRVSREEGSMRNPQMVIIDTRTLAIEKIPIKNAKPYKEIFKVDSKTVAKETKVEVASYDELIGRISCISSNGPTFEECLEKSNDEEVIELLKRINNERKK